MKYKYIEPVAMVMSPRSRKRISQLGRAALVTPERPYARGAMMSVATPLQQSQYPILRPCSFFLYHIEVKMTKAGVTVASSAPRKKRTERSPA